MKKILSFALVLVMLFAFATPVMAENANKVPNLPTGNFELGETTPLFVLLKQGSDNPQIWVPVPDMSVDEFMEMLADAGVELEGVDKNYVDAGNVGFFTGLGKDNSVVIHKTTVWVDKIDGIYYACNEGGLSHITYYMGSDPEPVFSGMEVIDEVYLTTITETIARYWQREVTPYEEWTQYVSPAYGSVTATTDKQLALKANLTNPKNGNLDDKNKLFNDLVVKNSNHFTYAKLAVADLADGVDLTLVVGNKIDFVGTGKAFINEDGKLEIKFDGDFYNAKFGAVAASSAFAPKNGNVHSEKIFSHDNNAVINLPAADKNGYIYLYVHFETLQYDLGYEKTDEWTAEGEYEFKYEEVINIDKDSNQVSITYEVYNADGNLIDEAELSDLEPGWYTVVFHDPFLDDPVEIPVEVIEGETVKVEYEAEYFEDGEPIINNEYLDDIVNELVIINKTMVI
ncbi:MAG TPA: hypothetical protein PLW11_00395 [Bacillota bacterium]|nr:hypothetical protein [Bacillota bacterium]